MNKAIFIGLAGTLLMLPSCATIEVKPIHITVDINIRVDRQLDNFFAFEKDGGAPATQPTTMEKTEATGHTTAKGA